MKEKEWIVKDTLNNKYVQELVRCKDCKHGIGDENAFVCGLKQLTAGMDWFCADGVAKDINVPNKEGR